MSVIVALILAVALLLAVVGVGLATGLGYAVHRRPALAQPIGIALTAFGILAGIAIAILQTLK